MSPKTGLIPAACGAFSAAAAAAYCAFQFGGGDPLHLSLALLLVGVGALILQLGASPQGTNGALVLWLSLLLPVYVVLQIAPWPTAILQFVNPTRAAIADSLGTVDAPVAWSSLTIATDKTWMHLSRVVGYVLVFVTARQAAARLVGWPWALVLPLVALGAGEAVVAINQSAAGEKVLGTYGSENHFAGLLEMTLPLAIALGLSGVAGEDRRRLAARLAISLTGLAAAGAMLVAIPLSQSRAGFLSMLGSLAVMAGASLLPRASRGQRWGMLAAAPVLGVLAVIALPTEGLIAGLGQLSGGDGRWPVFLASMRLFADFPLFGIGLGTFYPGFLPYQNSTLEYAWTTTHNDYLQFLNELGLVGAAVPAFVIVLVIRSLWRTLRAERGSLRGFVSLGCLGGLSAMLFHSFADFNMYVPANAMVFMYIMGMALGVGADAQPSQPRLARGARALRVAVATLAVWLVLNSAAWLAFIQRYEAEPEIESWFCRIGVCNYYVALAATKAKYDDVPAKIPPEELIALLPRDPAGGYNWIDLGESLEAHGRLDQARASFARGVELGPNVPFFLSRAARFHLRQGEYREGLKLMARSFAGNASYEEPGFDAYRQYPIPLDEVLEYGLGSRRTAQAYLKKRLRDGDVDAAEYVWSWIAAKGWSDDALAEHYVSGLVASREFERALAAWSEYGTRSGRGYADGNGAYNGGFEWTPTASPFDWRITPQPGVRVSLDEAPGTGRGRAARVAFEGTENVTFTGLSQRLWLPEGRYRLSALIRTEGITTREGVSLELSGNGVKVSTDPRAGSSDWLTVEQHFDVPPDAGMLQLRVVRPHSFRFDNLVAGTAWIDDVQITSLGGEPR